MTHRRVVTTRTLACIAIQLILAALLVLFSGTYTAAAEQQTGTVKGLVVDAAGNPVAGARVTAVRTSGPGPVDPFSPALDTATDSEGRFQAELPQGTYLAVAAKAALTSEDAPFYESRLWDVRPGKTKEVKLPLREGRPVKGVVVSKDTQKPIAHAGVFLGDGRTTRADADGRFVFEGVAASSSNLTAVADGFADTRIHFYMPSEGAYEARIEMEKGYTVRGRVLDESGKPVAGAHVQSDMGYLALRRCVTDEKGRYEVRGMPGGDRAWWKVEHPNYARLNEHGVKPPKSGDVVERDFVLTKGYQVVGRVLGPNGKPVKNALVAYGYSTCYVDYKDTRTKDSGDFRIEKIASDHEEFIVVKAKGLAPAYQRAKPGKGKAVPYLKFKLGPGQVAKGKVVDSKGAPVPGARIYAQMFLKGSNF